jgi:carboxyl-terminal processing protease
MNEDTVTTKPRENRSNNYLGVGLALVLALAAFFSGHHIGTGGNADLSMQAGLFSFFTKTPEPNTEVDLTEFWKVWDLMDEKFVSASSTTLTDEEKLRGAIGGLVKSYDDPYTVYMPPTDAASFDEEISGNFSGVGMEVGLRDDIITVIAPLPETPAFKAGILPGDKVIKIDDTSTEGMSIDEAVKIIRGEQGTRVKLTLYREGATELLIIDVVRDTINIPTTKTEKRGDVFIISLYSFNALAEMKMQEAMRAYVESGATKLVLDLRGNPGGYLQSAVAIASYFLPAGEVVVREQFGVGEGEELYRSQGRTLKGRTPSEMVVLIDGGSASASEILAGALSEHGVATLIGETTFGKGSVQELIELPGGSSLKVTIARWLTPQGRSISEAGLVPSLVIPRTADQIIANEDPQLDAAIRWVNGDKDVANYKTASSSDLFTE